MQTSICPTNTLTLTPTRTHKHSQLISLDPLFPAFASTKSSLVGDLDPVLNLNGDLAVATLLKDGTLSVSSPLLFELPDEDDFVNRLSKDPTDGCNILFISRYNLESDRSSVGGAGRGAAGIKRRAGVFGIWDSGAVLEAVDLLACAIEGAVGVRT